MGNRTFSALLIVSLSTGHVLAQSDAATTATDMDLVESEDLQKLLDEGKPELAPSETAEKPLEPAPSVEAVTETPTTPTLEPLNSADEIPEALPEVTDEKANVSQPEASPEKAETELSESLKESDPDFPEAISEKTDDDLEELKADLAGNGPKEVSGPEVSADTGAPNGEAASITGKQATKNPPVNDSVNAKVSHDIFDVGKEERELLELAASVQAQIPDSEWNELATQAKVSSYTVVKDDWLFKISKRLFGSGFYYPKIWALNPFITNPHLIEPGMVLHFSTGNGEGAPEVRLGAFNEGEMNSSPGAGATEVALASGGDDFTIWGEDAKPEWLNERKNLVDQGVYVQYATGDTIEDLEAAGRAQLVKEYENYDPPQSNLLTPPTDLYDKSGLDKNSRIQFNFKEGFPLNTFVTNNPVQDFGVLAAGADEKTFFTPGDNMYLSFDDSVAVLPGDRFSIYEAQGKVAYPTSDRSGFKYSILGQVRVLSKIGDKWEAELESATDVIRREQRVTVYTPKIERIIHTTNDRLIEAAIIGTYAEIQDVISYADVVYIDRGRGDGLEMGNVLETYGFKDRATLKTITNQPTYKTGELTVITLGDNFATCLVTMSNRQIYRGDIAITKSKEAALRNAKSEAARLRGVRKGLDDKALDNLDVELKVEDLNDSLLDKADKIELTEDELAELERQEREKSVIKDSERDLKALERLEKEIEGAEKVLDEAKQDEDKLLEKQSLDATEEQRGLKMQESLDEIEENLGKRYLDEDLNGKDNPYGLTEFDVEEVDELLNVDKAPE